MSLWTSIRGVFGGSGAPRRDAGIQYTRPFSIATQAADVNFDSAMQVSAVWAAIRLISETIASLPFDVYDVAEDGSRTPARNLALRKILVERPNTYQTPVEFWESILLNLVSSGNAYCMKQRLPSGQLTGLMPLSSQQMETELLKDEVTIVHRYTSGTVTRIFAQDSIWHIKLFGNGIVGLSPLSYAAPAIGVARAADDRVGAIYSNGAKPSGVLMIDRTLTDEQRQMVRDNFKGLSSGDDDRLYVLEANMDYKQISMSPQDIQLLESRRFQIEDIGRFFGVPSVLLNQTVGQSSLGSNVNEIMQAFYKLNLRPYIEKIESSITRWLVPDGQKMRYHPEFNFDALLRADSLSRAQTWREMINSGQLTPNEARALEGRAPLEGGENLMVQGAMIPISAAGQPTPPAPEPMDDPEE